MLQCVAICCSVLQCVAVCCSVLQCAAVCCSALHCVAVCCSVLQCAVEFYHNSAMCQILVFEKKLRSVLAVALPLRTRTPLHCVAVCCSVLQCVAMRRSASQCVAVPAHTHTPLQHVAGVIDFVADILSCC